MVIRDRFICMCVHVCVFGSMFICSYVHVCGGQRFTLVLSVLVLYPMVGGNFLLTLELTGSAGHLAPGYPCLSLPPWFWDFRHVSLFPAFYVGDPSSGPPVCLVANSSLTGPSPWPLLPTLLVTSQFPRESFLEVTVVTFTLSVKPHT